MLNRYDFDGNPERQDPEGEWMVAQDVLTLLGRLHGYSFVALKILKGNPYPTCDLQIWQELQLALENVTAISHPLKR